MKRVVVTGIGVITSLGAGKGPFLRAIRENVSGLSDITLFPTGNRRTRFGGEIKNVPVVGENRARFFLQAAYQEAFSEAGLPRCLPNADVFIGTAHGSLDRWERYMDSEFRDESARDFSACQLPGQIFNGLAENVNIKIISTACTSSTIAAGLALRKIQSGHSTVCVVAGIDILSSFIFAGFDALRALTPTLCRPFDRRRDGLVLGEGAAVLIFENLEHARQRSAPVYGELTGFSTTSDAVHMTAPDRAARGMTAAIKNVLAQSMIGHDGLDYINLHGTGTVFNDRAECMAVKCVFGMDGGGIPMSSIKPVVGHSSGAAGAIEAALCLLCLRYGLIPGTLNHGEPEEDFAQFDFVPGQSRESVVKTALTINSAFGGNNAALLFKAV